MSTTRTSPLTAPATQLVPPATLRPHPALANLPAWADDDPRFHAICDHVVDGITDPLRVTSRMQVVDLDDIHRLRAAKRQKLEEIPIVILPDEEAVLIAAENLAHRWHLTPGQRAYLLYPTLKAAHEQAKHRRLSLLKNGAKPQCSPVSAPSGNGGTKTEDFAARLGISRDTFDRAAKVHALFDRDHNYRALMEPRIMAEANDDPVGLGAVIAGHDGYKKRGADRPDNGQLDLFTRGLTTLAKRWTYWTELDEEDRATARQTIRDTVAAMPPELRKEWTQALEAAK